jgi:phage terminase large subunit
MRKLSPADKAEANHLTRQILAYDALIDEADSYKWAETKDGDLKDQPVKAFDHGMDAMRYAAYTHLQAAPAWGLW